VLNLDAYNQIVTYVKMLMTKLLIVSHELLPHSPPKHEKDDDKSFSVDLKMFDINDSNAYDPDDCCYHIEKVSTSIQIFSIFITSLMITN
jgi:hypothetical protein